MKRHEFHEWRNAYYTNWERRMDVATINPYTAEVVSVKNRLSSKWNYCHPSSVVRGLSSSFVVIVRGLSSSRRTSLINRPRFVAAKQFVKITLALGGYDVFNL